MVITFAQSAASLQRPMRQLGGRPADDIERYLGLTQLLGCLAYLRHHRSHADERDLRRSGGGLETIAASEHRAAAGLAVGSPRRNGRQRLRQRARGEAQVGALAIGTPEP